MALPIQRVLRGLLLGLGAVAGAFVVSLLVAPAASADEGPGLLDVVGSPVTDAARPVLDEVAAPAGVRTGTPTEKPVTPAPAKPGGPVAKEAAGPVADRTVKRVATKVLEPTARSLEPVTTPVAKAVRPVVTQTVEPVARLADPVLAAAAPVTEPVLAAVAPVTEPVLDALAPVAQPLAPVADRLVPGSHTTSDVVPAPKGADSAPVAPQPSATVAEDRAPMTAAVFPPLDAAPGPDDGTSDLPVVPAMPLLPGTPALPSPTTPPSPAAGHGQAGTGDHDSLAPRDPRTGEALTALGTGDHALLPSQAFHRPAVSPD